MYYCRWRQYFKKRGSDIVRLDTSPSTRDRVCSRELILLRTADMRGQTPDFARQLVAESGRQLACLVDERAGPVDTGGYAKVALTREACEQLALFCPEDFAWRCGDYGLYLARRQYPHVERIWLVEGDVRISGGNLGDFFDIFDGSETVDLITAHYRQSAGAWYWDHAIAARDSVIHRCLFDVLRVSVPAIDRLLKRRQQMSRSRVRRASWPNDESFLATTLSNDGSLCRDLNSFGPTLYTEDTLTFHNAFDGAVFKMNQEQFTIYHPVLYGEAYERKLAKLRTIAAGEPLLKRLRRRVIHYLNQRDDAAPAAAR